MTSFLHSGKRESVNADIAEHLVKFLFPYCSLWGAVADHFSSALLSPCPSFNTALSYLYLVWRTCWTQTLWAAPRCAGLLCSSPAYSHSYWNRILPNQRSRQETLHNRAKINGSEVKGQKDDEPLLPAVPEHFTPRHPTEPLHPLFRGRSVAFPSAEWRNTVTFHLRWEGHKACSSQTRLCHAAELIRASLLVI